jgi:hypothetical protein
MIYIDLYVEKVLERKMFLVKRQKTMMKQSGRAGGFSCYSGSDSCPKLSPINLRGKNQRFAMIR